MKDLSNKNVIHINRGNFQYLQFKRLLEHNSKLKHCFTLKELDYKNKSKNDDHYKIINNELGLNYENIIHPKQTHTNNVEIVSENSTSLDFANVDGLITNLKNKELSLVFADCTALLFYDPIKNVISNVHSGWRGTVNKIGKNAVNKMVSHFGCNPADIICCIGPTIRSCHFQVEDDVKKMFENAFKDNSIIKKGSIIEGRQKYYIDAVTANINMLRQCGLKDENIIDSEICTVCNSDVLHSYRAHKEFAGRNAAIMCLI